MLAQAYLSPPLLGVKITIDRPKALTSPSSGKLASVKTLLWRPISIVPNLAERSPT